MSLVTGGASGLGRAVVERLAQQDGKVVLCDLPKSNGPDVAKQIGENVLFAPMNVNISFSCYFFRYIKLA